MSDTGGAHNFTYYIPSAIEAIDPGGNTLTVTGHGFDGGALVSPAYVTVIHNGVLLHHHQPIQGPTGHKIVASYAEPHGPVGPIMLQDHGDLVRFRNIWVRPIEGYDQA